MGASIVRLAIWSTVIVLALLVIAGCGITAFYFLGESMAGFYKDVTPPPTQIVEEPQIFESLGVIVDSVPEETNAIIDLGVVILCPVLIFLAIAIYLRMRA